MSVASSMRVLLAFLSIYVVVVVAVVDGQSSSPSASSLGRLFFAEFWTDGNSGSFASGINLDTKATLPTLNVTEACQQGVKSGEFFDVWGGVVLQDSKQVYLFNQILNASSQPIAFWSSLHTDTWKLSCLSENFPSQYANLRHFVYDDSTKFIFAFNQDPYLSKEGLVIAIDTTSFTPKLFATLPGKMMWGESMVYDQTTATIYICQFPVGGNMTTWTISTVSTKDGSVTQYTLPHVSGGAYVSSLFLHPSTSALMAVGVSASTSNPQIVSVSLDKSTKSASLVPVGPVSSDLYIFNSVSEDVFFVDSIGYFVGVGKCGSYTCPYLYGFNLTNGTFLSAPVMSIPGQSQSTYIHLSN